MPLTQIFQVRWVIKMTRGGRLPPIPNGVIYGLLAEANREGGGERAIPEGCMVLAPEWCRTRLFAGEDYAFGARLLADSRESAALTIRRLTNGLAQLGRNKPRGALGGNFRLLRCEDSIGKYRLDHDLPTPLSDELLQAQIESIRSTESITLRLLTPLRVPRPGKARASGHRFLDRMAFDSALFLRGIQKRLLATGISRYESADWQNIAVELRFAELAWLDLGYGWQHSETKGSGESPSGPISKKTIGGIVGRIRIRINDPMIRAAIVHGQWAHVGRNVKWGFGAYRIEEAPDPTPCMRSQPLLRSLLRSASLDRLSQEMDLEPGELRATVNHVHSGAYLPGQVQRIRLARGSDGERELQVPNRLDRVLQRLVLDGLSPALDLLLESSSVAWRKGFGRHTAARRLREAHRAGFHWAVRADVDRFFDSIPHDELRVRLFSRISDEATTALIFQWIKAAIPDADVGLPTGSPLSPMLGNLFLDEFDECIHRQGGRLVRYADDFMILCKTREEAERLHLVARHAAGDLQLKLNEDAAIVDLSEPFEFVGYRFESHETWSCEDLCPPQRVSELKWRDAERPVAPDQLRLRGEQEPAANEDFVTIIGPEIVELIVNGQELNVRYRGEQRLRRVRCEHADHLVLLGLTTLPRELMSSWLRESRTIWLSDFLGRPQGLLLRDETLPPELIVAQVDASRSPERALSIARSLVASKLRNYAALARDYHTDETDRRLEPDLREAAERALMATTFDQLRGIEGSGAARWFGQLDSFLGKGFTFSRRVAPNAEDPVNLLLNLGYSWLYRYMQMTIRATGLVESIGFLHRPTDRFAPLASDFQEPFRHLVDRTVIDATHQLSPRQFSPATSGEYRLRIQPGALRAFTALLWKRWSLWIACTDREPRSYRNYFLSQARALRRHLLNPESPFQPFEQP